MRTSDRLNYLHSLRGNPWAVLVVLALRDSEVAVAAAVLAAFPSPAVLSSAPLEDVEVAAKGMQQARILRSLAAAFQRNPPTCRNDVELLPGVGNMAGDYYEIFVEGNVPEHPLTDVALREYLRGPRANHFSFEARNAFIRRSVLGGTPSTIVADNYGLTRARVGQIVGTEIVKQARQARQRYATMILEAKRRKTAFDRNVRRETMIGTIRLFVEEHQRWPHTQEWGRVGGLPRWTQVRRMFGSMAGCRRTILSPGSGLLGCTCPVMDNHYGSGRPDGSFWTSTDCPLHLPNDDVPAT